MPFEKPKKGESLPIFRSDLRAGKRRSYSIQIHRTDKQDHYITISECSRQPNGTKKQSKMYLFKEDFNRFCEELFFAVEKIQTEYMPDYDYDESEQRQGEYEAKFGRSDQNGDTDFLTDLSCEEDDENNRD